MRDKRGKLMKFNFKKDDKIHYAQLGSHKHNR